jgi:hypothetical protein
MKQFFAFVITIFLTSSIQGQNQFIDVSGGVNLARIGNYTHLRMAPAAGLGYELRFAKIMSFKTGIMYNERGGNFKTGFWDNVSQEFYNRNLKVQSHYVSLPVLLGLVSTKETYGFGRFGLMISYLLDATQGTPQLIDGKNVIGTRNIKHLFNTFDVVGLIEGGVGGSVSSRIIIEGALGIQVGLTNALNQNRSNNSIYDPNTSSIQLPKYPHFGFSAMIGLKYRFGAKLEE